MEYREFGKAGIRVSAVGFGAWAIGGNSYGAVDQTESLCALARAEELGCNFVDTAAVYGNSESLLGKFLSGRRQRWYVATKYSGQAEGLTALAEHQLRLLGSDVIDLYQIHWVPRGKDESLYEELYRLKKSGKTRFVGVSLYTVDDIDFVLEHALVDSIQVCFSLLDPQPFLARLDKIRAAGVGVIVRSALRSGFLTGKFKVDSVFSDPNDQRHRWNRSEIVKTVTAVDRFRFLEQEAGSMLLGAVRYALSFPEVSTILMSTKTAAQADINFGKTSGYAFDRSILGHIATVQKQLRLNASHPIRHTVSRVYALACRLLGRKERD